MRHDLGTPTSTWRFGAVELDETSGTVSVSGEPCDLPRSAVTVLFVLARAQGEVVTKRDLLESGWPGRVVHENSLAKAVGSLRRALGEDGEAIEVVHGYGYRLAAPVAAMDAHAASDGLDDLQRESPPSRATAMPPTTQGHGALPAASVGFVGGALLAGIAVWWWMADASPMVPVPSPTSPLQAFLSEDLLQAADPYESGDDGDSLRAAVARAASRIDARFADDPATASALHARVADAFSGWGEYEKAVAHLQRARMLAVSAYGAQSQEVSRLDIASCQQLRLAGDTRAGEPVCARAAAAADRLDEADAMQARVAQAKLQFEIGAYPESVAMLRPIAAGSAEAAPAIWADAQWFLGLGLRKLARYAEAETAFRALVEARREQHGDTHPLTAWAYADYGDYLVDAGRYQEAEETLARAQSIFDASLGADHPESLSPRYSLAVMHLARSEWQPAAALLRPVLARYRQTLGTDHLWTLYTITELALAEAGLGNRESASDLLEEAARNGARLLYRRPAKAAHFQLRWARAWWLAGDNARSGKALDMAEAALADAFAAPHPWHARASCLRARLALTDGRAEQGRERANACLAELQQAAVPASYPLLAEARTLLATR